MSQSHPPDEARDIESAAAVVLAGGASRRMGRPKAFLTVGGRELLERALDAAAGACRSVVLVGADLQDCRDAALRYGWEPAPDPDPTAASPLLRRGSTLLRISTDRRPGRGPLAGLEMGWTESPSSVARWWVLAVDLPFATQALGRRLLEALRVWEEVEGAESAGAHAMGAPRRIARAVVPSAAGRLQPLCAAYGIGALPAASRCLDEGVRAMGAFLDRLEIRTLELGPADALLLLNVNTPEGLERARARAESAPESGKDGPSAGTV